jgi:hypothetical protein
MLNPEDLKVESFSTSSSESISGTAYCCTGCDSGCGFNPTGGGCESGSGQPYCVDNNTIAAA